MAKVVGYGFMNEIELVNPGKMKNMDACLFFPVIKTVIELSTHFTSLSTFLHNLLNLVKFEDCKIEKIPVKWGTTSPVCFVFYF